MAQKTLTAEDLFDRCDRTVQAYGERDSGLDDLEDYYFLENDQDPEQGSEEEGIEVVRLPYGTNAIDLVQDLLAGADLMITVPALSEGKRDKELADAAEVYLRAVMHSSSRAQRQHLMTRAAWLAGMRGQLAGRVMAMPSWLEKEGEGEGYRTGARIPLLIQLRDPRYVYPEFGLDGLAYVVERRTRTVLDVRNMLDDEEILPDADEDDEIEWSEYWDAERYCYWADGQVVEKAGKAGPWPHLYGGIPYAFEFARQTGRMEPEKRARALLAAAAPVIDRMVLLDSAEATFIGQYNGDAVTVYSDEAEFELDTRPGAVNYLRPNERVEWLRASRQPIETQAAAAKYNAALDRATFPSSMYGMDPGRVMAGYALSLLNQSGQVRLAPLIDCVERLLESLFENALMVSEHYLAELLGGEAIPFYQFDEGESDEGERFRMRRERKLDARRFGGFYHVEVQLGELMPADEQANIVLAGRARQAGPDGRPLLSWETTVENYKLADSAATERDRIDRELAWNDPEVAELRRALYVAQVKADLAEELAKLDIDADAVLAQAQARKQAEQQAQQAQQPQPAGLPPELMAAAQQGLMPQPMGGMMPGEGGPPPMPGPVPGMMP